MIIVGAGMAGLLAGNMLAHRQPKIIEGQSHLPNNHSAVLRFRSAVVGDVLGIPFKKVTMIKSSLPWRNKIADALAYSFKNSRMIRSDRSIIAGDVIAERYIAPSNLISSMAKRMCGAIRFGYYFNPSEDQPIVVSTMPMPALMCLLDYPTQPQFHFVSGTNVKATVAKCDAYVSLSVPDPNYLFSRISITGNELIVELPFGDAQLSSHDIAATAADLIGIDVSMLSDVRAYTQPYAKIVPIEETVRRDFIHWATMNHNIYSLGRFATWRPQLLMDDLVRDVRIIDGWIDRKDNYALKMQA